MQITLHIGVPKTGSSAIQAHLGLNRGWFDQRKIAIPTTGYSDGFGHVLLFEDTTNTLLGTLQEELDELESSGTEHAILSWEGLNMYDQVKINNLYEYLKGHDVTVLAYLREQAEVIQSGYLQAVKQRRQRRNLEDYQTSNILLKPMHINYENLLDRYANAFGRENIEARVYERSRLKEGNIVLDFLDALGLELSEDFILASSEQNISLDVGSARLLNIMDSIYSDPEDRAALIDLLLANIAANGHDKKYFLPQVKIDFIRDHYYASNQAVAEKYMATNLDDGGIFSSKNTGDIKLNLHALAAEKLEFLNSMKDYHYWRGEALSAGGLIKITSQVAGWSTIEPAGVWSNGPTSVIRFRLCKSTISPFLETLRLSLAGQYFQGNEYTTVKIPGEEGIEVDLSDAVLEVPLKQFDEYGRITIGLEHHSAASPHSLGMHEDFRELAYMVQRASYEVL